MLTPTLTKFLGEISTILRQRDARKLCDYLVIEPPYAPIYETLRAEVRSSYNSQDGTSAQRLEAACQDKLGPVLTDPEGNSPTWTAYVKFMAQYFAFLRDVDVGNLLATYELLSELLQKANSALTHPSSGVLLLPTVVSYSRILSRLAIGLDKQPHLIAHLQPRQSDEGSTRETLPERAANTLRQAFVTCLNDRSGTSSTGLDAQGRPEGKKRGIYTIANQCLKILFQCRKIRGAAQIFENIYNQSPPLAAFPKSERVTYLYYLGRFSWANGHFGRAREALQHAWDSCHKQCPRQARLIAIYLMAANIVCGRFPKQALFEHVPDLRQRFEPLCAAIRKGDLVAFRKLFEPGAGGENYAFFSRYRIDLQLRNRCEPFVWRTLVRRTFILAGEPGDMVKRKAPTLDLNFLLKLWSWQEEEYARQTSSTESQAGYVDEDFDGMDNGEGGENSFDMTDVISRLSSLIHQDLVNGYLSYRMQKLAIQGARQRVAVEAGFPSIWQVVSARSGGNEVPGWKLQTRAGMGGAAGRSPFGPGQVINLSGARPVGVS
ncbi:hypothetical protein K461DRAFT_232005 [Myriangium duriaei CBS 260.36]|uniref:PCI domain-containing protein n=1 Tax=Myriangium duriaei CBS 260.36 TaxID=1168546 RepID=A0A9P4IXH4_9PEZI|nr:hypothetical protein K461DRAFT_232005 [Myriangium duriaei CBS 260.36]